jgi:signal transduction histidine kinase
MRPILGIRLTSQLDASAARQRSRQIAALCGFGTAIQTRLSTTVSELARGAIDQTHPGQITFALDGVAGCQNLVITLVPPAAGSTAAHSLGEATFAPPAYPPMTSAAVVAASRRFMDRIETDAADRRIVLHKACPAGGPFLDADAIARAVMGLAALPGDAALSEARQRNSDLARANEGVVLHNGQLQRQAASLISADRRKDEFLAILAHELRGPLSALAMAGEGLRKNPSDAGRVAGVGQLVLRQTAHMSRLVEDLLDVSRIVRDEVTIERLPVDLCDVVRAAVEQTAPAALRRGHAVATRLPDAPVLVEGDRTRLVQVLGNLVGNAVRYTPAGGAIEITLEADALAARLRVRDNGIGIDAALLPQVFELFVQAQRSPDSRESGLGLGLALVKALVQAHGGEVVAHSDGPDRGSRFEITLPRLLQA